ncbi:MAG TPA: hypothetical protein VN157_09990, partial [Caulobacter sp.]|nr:hypothetical protein [Caulobacter sp.]
MLRISDLKLPLGHEAGALAPAICNRLGIPERDLVSHAIARRAHDARKKAAILMVYTVDVALRDEAAVLARFERDSQVRVRPDTDYRLVARA